MNNSGPDLLGQLKRLLAATPAGMYAAPTITRRTLEEIVREITSLRAAVDLAERARAAQRASVEDVDGAPAADHTGG